MTFHIANIPRQAAAWWRECTSTESSFRVANLFGPGVYTTAPFLVLGCWSIGWALRNAFLRFSP